MDVFEVVPKKWGNSWGIVIPKKIAKESIKEGKTLRVIILPEDNPVKKMFASIPKKTSMEEAMNITNEGEDLE